MFVENKVVMMNAPVEALFEIQDAFRGGVDELDIYE